MMCSGNGFSCWINDHFEHLLRSLIFSDIERATEVVTESFTKDNKTKCRIPNYQCSTNITVISLS